MSLIVNSMQRLAGAALCGAGTSAAVYGYNRAGELGKLPDTWGYVTPAKVFAQVIGEAAFLSYLGRPKLALPITTVVWGATTLKALQRSSQEFSSKNNHSFPTKDSL